jgi:DNA-binding transcriptional ArsR family regulator
MNMSSYDKQPLDATQGRHASSASDRAPSVRDRCDVDCVHLDAVRRARRALPGEGGLEWVTQLLGLLTNPTRLKVLFALLPAEGEPRPELCVCDLAVVCGASPSMTSHQLRLLRTAGLVRQRRVGKLAFYQLEEGPLAPLLVDMRVLATAHATSIREAPRRTGRGA